MKERPILFSAPMVRAILAGQKTQTRRILTVPWKGSTRALPYEPYWVDNDGRLEWCDEYGDYHDFEETILSPYGAPGDRLWVRETIFWVSGGLSVYGADGAATKADAWPWQRKCLPSIHCPRGLSRITLEVTGVRVERLQAISEEDAKAEGVAATRSGGHPAGDDTETAREVFQHLWDRINGKSAAWASNPWVWVVEFRRLP